MRLAELNLQIMAANSVINNDRVNRVCWPNERERTDLMITIKAHLRTLGIWRRNIARA